MAYTQYAMARQERLDKKMARMHTKEAFHDADAEQGSDDEGNLQEDADS